jgi:cysteine desulfurase
MNHIYFDNAATSPLDARVLDEMVKVMRDDFGNPSSTHTHGRKVRTLIEEARKSVAKLLGVTPGEIFFTSGGTEADNMAIRCSVEDLGITHVISSKIEHHAVLHTLEELAHKGIITLDFVNILPNGHIDTQHLETLLQGSSKTLVSLMHANNELGNMIDIDEVAQLCKKYDALFHCDTVQTMGHYPLNFGQTPVDFAACAAHKFNGPKGIGFIYINHNVKIHPFITGGAQERNMRGGTENVYGIVGLAKALELACAHFEQEKAHIQDLKNYMISQLKEQISNVTFNGDAEGRSLYTVLNVRFPASPFSEMMLFKLDIEGVSCSGGSACSSGSSVGSHVLAALQVPQETASVRFSFGKQNTREEVDFVIGKLAEMFAEVKETV